MTDQQAKEILLLYRPGSPDANDSGFAEALAHVHQSPELKDWFEKHCTVQNEIRARFRETAIPEGLKEQIISEYKARSIGTQLKKSLILAALAVLVTLGIILAPRLMEHKKIEDQSLAAYRGRMVTIVSRAYDMDLETDDLAQVRSYLARRGLPTDWVLTGMLEQTPLSGCGVLNWQGKPVSMICFRSGKPLQAARKSDLFLFVVDSSDVQNAPEKSTPEITNVNDLSTATWRENGKTYVLAVEGDEALLRKFL